MRIHRIAWLGLVAAIVSSPALAATYIYPTKGQSKTQQNKDKGECTVWATDQTGFDPANPPPAPKAPPPPSVPADPTQSGLREHPNAVRGAIVRNPARRSPEFRHFFTKSSRRNRANRAGINASGKKARRRIGREPACPIDRFFKRGPNSFRVEGDIDVRSEVGFELLKLEVSDYFDFAPFVDKDTSGLKLVNAFEHRVGARNKAESEVLRDRGDPQLSVDFGIRE